jgi:hypothetical protein
MNIERNLIKFNLTLASVDRPLLNSVNIKSTFVCETGIIVKMFSNRNLENNFTYPNSTPSPIPQSSANYLSNFPVNPVESAFPKRQSDFAYFATYIRR